MLALLLTVLLLTPSAVSQVDRPVQPAGEQASQSPSPPVPVPEPTEQARRYYRSGNLLFLINFALGIAIPLLVLFSGLSARIRRLAHRIGRKWFFLIALYGILITLLSFVIDLPMSFYGGYLRPHEYGLSNQTLGKWSGDRLKELMVNLVVTPLVLWIPFLLLKKSPRRWWLYTGLALVPFVIFSILISPVLIDPLFNEFGPMKNKELEARILTLAQRAGIEGARVYEVDKSVDTKTLNAYVTGLWKTKRIVLWDTTLRVLTPREVLAVMGHEMGHFVLGHMMQLTAFVCLYMFVGLYAVHRTAGFLIARYREPWGFDSLADVASLPLIFLLFNLALFVLNPAINAVTRHNEHESDRFALEITRDNHAAATAFVKLGQQNLAIPRPGPIYRIFRQSHPSLGDRIDFANSYRPWERAEALVYGKLFR